MLAIKRLIDVIVTIILIIILSPLLFLISFLIKIDSKGSVFFIQERAGLHGRSFNIYKFRTMIPNAIKRGTGIYTSENDSRITKIGGLLRNSSLDELPQLFNILKGDMSLVGPRPTLMYQVEQYDETQRKRLNMKPGVTGLAQVNGRNSLTWPQRIEYDVEYVKNWSLLLDIKIFIKTVKVVLFREGVYADKENFIVKDKSELETRGEE